MGGISFFDFQIYLDISEEEWSVSFHIRFVNVILRHTLQEQVEHLDGVVVAEPGQDVEGRPALVVHHLGINT